MSRGDTGDAGASPTAGSGSLRRGQPPRQTGEGGTGDWLGWGGPAPPNTTPPRWAPHIGTPPNGDPPQRHPLNSTPLMAPPKCDPSLGPPRLTPQYDCLDGHPPNVTPPMDTPKYHPPTIPPNADPPHVTPPPLPICPPSISPPQTPGQEEEGGALPAPTPAFSGFPRPVERLRPRRPKLWVSGGCRPRGPWGGLCVFGGRGGDTDTPPPTLPKAWWGPRYWGTPPQKKKIKRTRVSGRGPKYLGGNRGRP